MMRNSKCFWSTRIHQSCASFVFVLLCVQEILLGGGFLQITVGILYIYKLKLPSYKQNIPQTSRPRRCFLMSCSSHWLPSRSWPMRHGHAPKLPPKEVEMRTSQDLYFPKKAETPIGFGKWDPFISRKSRLVKCNNFASYIA